ncbi:MAG: glycosyltransferase [Anaerolineales bacterium]|nr:MAG: glycosyltransferase [Anaerolineales bacterium]
MRIGMMTDAYKPYVSGVTSYIDLNKRALEALGHEVYVFTFGDLEHPDEDPRVIRSPGLPLSDTGFYLSLRHSTQAQRIIQTMDIIHVHHPFMSGRLALIYGRKRNIPIIFTNHTRYDLYAQTRVPLMPAEVSMGMLQAYMPAFCENTDLVISPSRGMEKILRQYGVTSHIEVVPNGADLQPFLSAAPLSREKFGFDADDILIVYMGRIAPEKNLELLLGAFAGVSRAVPRTKLLVVGGGQKEHEEGTKEFANELEIMDRVKFTGTVPYAKLPSYLAMCDIFATASVTEVHPFSVIEGMAAGLPIVGIDSPGIGDSIADGETGLLSVNDLASYTAKLTALCLNKDLQKQMGKAAQEASHRFSIENTTKIMLGHYTRLASNTRPVKESIEERLRSVLKEFFE